MDVSLENGIVVIMGQERLFFVGPLAVVPKAHGENRSHLGDVSCDVVAGRFG